MEAKAEIPEWAVSIIRDVAETKATVSAIRPEVSEVRQKIEQFITRDEYNARHTELGVRLDKLETERVNPLWDAHNRTAGEVANNQRTAKAWQFGITLAIAILTLWVIAHSGNITVHL